MKIKRFGITGIRSNWAFAIKGNDVLSIGPTPTDEEITIDLIAEGPYELTAYDEAGEAVSCGRISEFTIRITPKRGQFLRQA